VKLSEVVRNLCLSFHDHLTLSSIDRGVVKRIFFAEGSEKVRVQLHERRYYVSLNAQRIDSRTKQKL